MKFACPHCSQLMEVETVHAGLEVECPSCGQSTVIPQQSADPDVTIEYGSESPRTIVEKVWKETIDGASPDVREDVTMTIKGATMAPRSDTGRTMQDAVKVRPKDVAQQGASATIPEYELMRMLGEGGMGMVYEARQTSIDRSIAVKMIKPDVAGEDNARQFLAEAVATADLDHPNIVPIHDLGMNNEGALFYAMKQVKGTEWKKILPNNTLDENLDILMRVADAVAFAHNRGVIHRDLKPENVMLGDFGEVLLMDWGLAAAVAEGAKAEPLDPDHAIGGTPSYMAPEMAMGDASKIGYGSDIYLLGAILFEIVTGGRPHTGRDAMDCLGNAAENIIVQTGETGELMDIALKAMATEPQDRYESTKAFQEAVRDYQRHEESIALVAKATEGLQKARSSSDYNVFARAVFQYEEARELWPENSRATAGAAEAQLAYATCAFEKCDYDLAVSLLDRNEAGHSELLGKVEAAKNERDARKKRMRALKITSAISAAAALLILSVAAIWINKARQQAEQQRNLAEEQRQRAEGALSSLRGTAPTFYKLAQEMVEAQKFGEALTNINYAISLVPEEATYHSQKGNILQSMLNMKGAADAYETAIRHDPTVPHAAGNLELCKKIISDNVGRKKLPASSLSELHAEMQKQERNREAFALSSLLKDKVSTVVPALRKVFQDRGFNPGGVRARPDGTVSVDFRGSKRGMNDVSFLRGLPINSLYLPNTVTDLSVLEGMPLTELFAPGNIKTLKPLAGMRLKKLLVGEGHAVVAVDDLSPLRGMPLTSLSFYRAAISDLSPLEGMQLEELDIDACFEIKDLSVLKGMPLRRFSMQSHYNARKVSPIRDISPLRGAPLEDVDMRAMPLVRDISPLADSPLEQLAFLPEEVATGFNAVRKIKSLKTINMQPASIFWQKYDKGEFYAGAEFKDRIEKVWPGARLGCVGDGTVSLKIYGRKDVVDLSPLKGVPLSELSTWGSPDLKDLSPLKGMPLRDLCLGSGYASIQTEDLSPLEGMPLEVLVLCGMPVSDLSSLKGMTLKSLHIGGTKVTDLSSLAGLPLKSLNIGGTKVRDLSPLKGMHLTDFDAFGCQEIHDLSPLAGMPLVELRLGSWGGGAPIKDLSPLKGMPLKALSMEQLPVSDLSPLAGMPLQQLWVKCQNVSDLSGLAGMPLKKLALHCAGVTDISPLRGMPLAELVLEAKQIKDFSPLAGMPLKKLTFYPSGDAKGLDVVRGIDGLLRINALSATEFWKEYDAGEFTKK